MGIAIARELAERGAEVNLIAGPLSEEFIPYPGITLQKVQSAEDMFNACTANQEKYTIIIMAAAVADFTPLNASATKIKKTESNLVIELTKTRDILKTLGENKVGHQILVGFALETNNEREHALNKLKAKNADLIILNSLNDKGAGFGHDTNKVTIFEKNGKETSYEQKSKQQVAKDIVDKIVNMLYA